MFEKANYNSRTLLESLSFVLRNISSINFKCSVTKTFQIKFVHFSDKSGAARKVLAFNFGISVSQFAVHAFKVTSGRTGSGSFCGLGVETLFQRSQSKWEASLQGKSLMTVNCM